MFPYIPTQTLKKMLWKTFHMFLTAWILDNRHICYRYLLIFNSLYRISAKNAFIADSCISTRVSRKLRPSKTKTLDLDLSYFLFLHFFRKSLTITSVWSSCARFAWKMRKLIEPFMQTNVRLPSDTLPGASQWAEQTTLFLVNHSLGEPYIHEKKKTHRRVIFLNRHTVKTRSSYRNGI